MRGMIFLKKARNLLTYLLALVFTLSSFPGTSLPVINASAAEGVNGKASDTEVVSLKEVYKDHFLIGNTVSPSDLTDAAKYDFMKFHYNVLTPENATKPDSIWSSPTSEPSFTSADNMLTKLKPTDSIRLDMRWRGIISPLAGRRVVRIIPRQGQACKDIFLQSPGTIVRVLISSMPGTW